jgi:hypothetical protein
MTERSRFWDGTTVGDAATDAPYDAPTEFARVMRSLNPAIEVTVHKGGVLNTATGYNAYNFTAPGGGIARIASGLGNNTGTWHESDANVDIAIPTPASATRIDRITMRKTWATQVVRLTRIAGAEGGGAPAITQTLGTIWDVPICQVQITTGGVITFPVDERPFISNATHLHTDTSQGGTVSHTALTTIGTNTHAQLDTAVAASAAHASGAANSHPTIDSTLASHTSSISSLNTSVGTLNTHAAAALGTSIHGVTKINTTGTQSLGSPVNGAFVFTRAAGGTLTVTTPSGAIVVGGTNFGASCPITSNDSITFSSDSGNWYAY